MKKFLIGLVTGLLLAGLGGLILLFSLIRFGERRPAVSAGSVLVFRLWGPLPELAPTEIPLPAFESRSPVTVTESWDLLRKAAADSRIQALVFEPRGVTAGWAKLAEVRSGLIRFKESGKPVVAYLRSPGAREYYLASAADYVYVAREDLLDLKGLRIEATYYRGSLDKLGVEMEIEYAGKYKDAADAFARTSMTPETRDVLNSMLDQVYTHLVESIASGRNMSSEQVRAVLDQGPFLATQAKANGLVDDLLYEDEMWERLKSRLGGSEPVKLSYRDYMRVPASTLGLEGPTRVAIIIGQGTIVGGDGDLLPGVGVIRAAAFNALLRGVAEDDSVRGVILRIDSPGGDAIASDEILHEVKALSRRKPMVISMSETAASGGYYIAMSGDPILAYANTYTGSIGVLYGKLNVSSLYEKLGWNVQILTRGKHAAIDSMARPLTAEGRRKLREGVDQVYGSFLERVAEGRSRPVSEIEPLAQGRVWMGAQAAGNGLVDEIGGLDRAIARLRERAGIAASDKLRIVVYPRKKSLFEELFGRSGEQLLATVNRWRFAAIQDRLAVDFDLLDSLARGGMLRLVPYSIRIQ